ncbi:MAG: SEC-C domain-containing protein [Phycisphaerae bacterium]|nr:SEC-C domain-containing protein [Phycisphaerae bacterium]
MPYVSFHDYFPEIAERETRTLILPRPTGGLPQGPYSLIEMFCDEAGCDCRRVFFYVVSSFREGPEAVVAYGWEDEAFYARWMKDDDPLVIETLKGPTLNLGSPQSDLAPAILDLVTKVALTDTAFIERVKRHYRMFRDKVDSEAGRSPDSPVLLQRKKIGVITSGPFPRLRSVPEEPSLSSERVGRNDPCPCGSGRKYKKCCMGRD